MASVYPVCVTASDLHLSHTPPPCRSKEIDWYFAMKSAISRLKKIRDDLNPNIPIVIAGDIFDKWNPPHELVNFALANLPHVFAVPGQHDLPHHNLSDIKKSAYWTLVEAGRITNLEYGKPIGAGELDLYGFPWGSELTPLDDFKVNLMCLRIAVVHAMIYTKDTGYTGAPLESKAKNLIKKLEGFDCAIFGDNHKGFLYGDFESPPMICNNGSFMRTRSDQEDYVPCVGVIYSDGSIVRVALEAPEVFHKVSESKPLEKHPGDFKELLGGLQGLTEVSGDFKQEIQRELGKRERRQQVKDIVWTAVEEDR